MSEKTFAEEIQDNVDFWFGRYKVADEERTSLRKELEEKERALAAANERAEKAENDVAFADGFATAAGQRNVRLMAELAALRSSLEKAKGEMRGMEASIAVAVDLIQHKDDYEGGMITLCRASELPFREADTKAVDFREFIRIASRSKGEKTNG